MPCHAARCVCGVCANMFPELCVGNYILHAIYKRNDDFLYAYIYAAVQVV